MLYVMALRYGEVIAANIRATRARKRLLQADVVDRMRALGYTDWHRQTLGKVERGERRLTAEELPALAWSLETNISVLLGVTDTDTVVFGGGEVAGRDLTMLALGRNNGVVRFDGNKPVFGKGVSSWRGEPEDDPVRDLV